ncbi:UPF0193 protein EVG1 homolog [Topomyia yanbarensis]|uniref:UPF0193 protein EVG1 homolog n=1 Tax=Topomyia yanbarensis TaxID=2498891 RepID=UPI00273CE61F|nr:UPF0193 protein EVG1 homolog [Topomyia yanbarensis]XP_058815840.1 UPF0193 protein EVG1 homolog [Topomyia yanbarensis]XP_058815841.1 UPF0193 protein EVG1 homolog [Topomyia yanbarensis]XP_058815842.1 UPF0193 protein EVG1 homolog [Topomyia yanbarensis]
MMDWPSSRVTQGGFFHAPKAKYTKETQDLIKVLMEEAKLTILQRNKINYHLRTGEPLPPPKEPKFEQEYSNFLPLAIPRKNIKKRSLSTIIESGAFDVEKYTAKGGKEPVEKSKLKLQERMAGCKLFPDDGRKRMLRPHSDEDLDFVPPDREAELLEEINERVEWLAEMEALGEGKKHRQVIHAQIAERLNEIKRLEKEPSN